MEPVSNNNRLLKRAFWLIRLRWIAIIVVCLATFVSSRFLNITLHDFALYCIAGILAIYNLLVLIWLKQQTASGKRPNNSAITRIINLQICTDLTILTVLLHYSGGIENPFVFYYIFHMIIASILLSRRDSYLHASYAVFLFGMMLLLEYRQVPPHIPHYCLKGFVQHCPHRDGMYVLGSFFVFATAIYLVVYMTGYISIRLRQAEQAHRQANAMLKEKDRIKDEYVVRVTHDIKADLAAIQSCLDVVIRRSRDTLDPGQADFLYRAHARTQKLAYFVRSLLSLTQMRLSNQFNKQPFQLDKTISTSIANTQSRAQEKSITLTSRIDPSLGVISGNEFSVEEMLSNLLLNAVKYTPENGKVTLTASKDTDHVIISIKDTGIGIPADEIDKIFGEFYRASNARSGPADGTGLGLSIVKHIIERHGGHISVESEPGKGTTFTVELPTSKE